MNGKYITPEVDSYNWILDRDPGYGDLLLVRITKDGRIRRPVVLFDSTGWEKDWEKPAFKSILKDEMQRYPSDVVAKFTVDKLFRHYLWRYSHSHSRHITHETQFTAIIPIDRAEYHRQRPNSDEAQLFELLESSLGIPVLLAEIDRAYEQWCYCNCPWNEYSSDMIQCKHAKCILGWYHMTCVGLDKDELPED